MRNIRSVVCCSLFVASLVVSLPSLRAQNGSQGSIQLTVQDPSGAVVPDADLTLVKIENNDTRTAKSSRSGQYSFVNLDIGTYRLTITREGFATKIFDRVVVAASQVDGLNAILSLGSASDTVRVSTDTTSVLETTSNSIGTVVDMKQIENLPLQGRDLTSFSRLVAGYTGTFNGLPSPSSGNNVDGTQGVASRAKYGDNGATQASVSPRVEAIEQMTVQTDQLDIGSGFGQSTTQLNYVTRRGGNKFHFRAYEDFRNSGLNATSWTYNTAKQRKPKLILNDFGVSAGGFIVRDKLFFFGSFATSRQPSGTPYTNSVFTPSAQGGNFTYTGTDNRSYTVNVFQLAANTNSGLPTKTNTAIAAQLAQINQSVAGASLTPVADPTLNTVNYTSPAPVIKYFPAGRLDYNISQKLRTYLSFLATTSTQPSGAIPAPFPGSNFNNQNAGNFNRNYLSSFGLDYIISPQVINQFKLGFLYAHNEYAYNVAPLYNASPVVDWAFPGDASPNNSSRMSGQNYTTPSGNYYPLFSLSDSITVQKTAHTMQFGFSAYREQDHYYNNPVGFANLSIGLATGDPALQAFSNGSSGTLPNSSGAQLEEAQQLYAVLTGRVSGIQGSYAYDNSSQQYIKGPGRYNLNELSQAWALFFQDSYRATPHLTLNYGLRWDFTGDNHDLTGAYHSALPDSLYGPTAPGDLFKPGALNGNLNPGLTALNHTYKPWNVSPQPAFGLAYNPQVAGKGFLHSLLGSDGGGTVIRAGYALRRYTEPYQFFWNAASNYGTFFYQFFGANPNTTGKIGSYTPGSVQVGASGPVGADGTTPFTNYVLTPTSVQQFAPQSQFTFVANSPGVNGMNPNIRQPYSQSWNLSIQRELGPSRVLEIRYNGNRTIHQWLQLNTNEVNVFENGFLDEFKRAQANLAASGGKTFAGGNATPILNAAFGPGSSAFTSAQFISYLNNGQVGALAAQLAGNGNATPQYFCNLVGSKFSPCPNNAGYNGAGAGYPINFFQANPYAGGRQTGYMTDAGYSNYNGLQVEFRQGNWKGFQLNANYTWSHSLGLASNNQYTAQANNIYTLRDLSKSYGPTLFDVTHVTHISGTYDLPFGRGRALFNHNAFVDRVIGGFNIGTILTYQTGTPFLLMGGYKTYNDYADGGVNLIGISPHDLQKAVGVYRLPGQTTANLIDPKYIGATGSANPNYIQPNATPGTIGRILYLHGPSAFYDDISVTKAIAIKEGVNVRLQSEFLNAFNHPVFGNTTRSTTATLQSTTFSRAGVTNETAGFGRIIELRANIEF